MNTVRYIAAERRKEHTSCETSYIMNRVGLSKGMVYIHRTRDSDGFFLILYRHRWDGLHKVRLGYDTITYYTIFCNLLMRSKIQVYNYRREQCLCERSGTSRSKSNDGSSLQEQ